MSADGVQVVMRRCTICDWEAQLVERGSETDRLCPWCYGPTERVSVWPSSPSICAPARRIPTPPRSGRLGGLKGGRARAASLSAKQRREIASKAARARWGKKR